MRYFASIIASALFLTAERVWQSFWIAFTAAAALLTLLLLDIPQSLGATWHSAFIIVYLAAMVLFILFKLKDFKIPSLKEVKNKAEEFSLIKHRPSAILKDKPAELLSEVQQALWATHITYAQNLLKHLRIYKPGFEIGAKDPFAIRYIALILLFTSLVIAGDDWNIKIKQGLDITLPQLRLSAQTFDIWVSPPEYTKLAELPLFSLAKEVKTNKITAPKGSLLKIRAAGYKIKPSITYNGKKYQLQNTSQDNLALDIKLQQSGTLKARGFPFTKIGSWNITIAADLPPEVAITALEETSMQTTKISYKLKEDYGINSLKGVIKQPNSPDSYFFSIPVEGYTGSSEQKYIIDLTDNILAGKEVELKLEAEDSAKQKASSANISFKIPERQFQNATARKIYQIRKGLIWSKEKDKNVKAANYLFRIIVYPQLYQGNIVQFMALKSAIARLLYHFNAANEKEVIDLLWNIALHLENSGRYTAQQDLFNALQELRNDLANNALDKKQLEEKLAALKIKMRDYIIATALEMQQNLKKGAKLPMLSSSLADKLAKKVNLQDILQQMQNLSNVNTTEELAKAVERLQQSIENFDPAKITEQQKKYLKTIDTLNRLDKIISDQERLLDKTNSEDDKGKIITLSLEQAKIEKDAEYLITVNKSTPTVSVDNLSSALKSMRQSETELQKSFATSSVIYQQNALRELKGEMDKAVEQLAKDLQNSVSFGFAPMSGNKSGKTDPLGRSVNDNESATIPQKSDKRRIQLIIEELRRRSNDFNRSQKERDYIDRLIH